MHGVAQETQMYCQDQMNTLKTATHISINLPRCSVRLRTPGIVTQLFGGTSRTYDRQLSAVVGHPEGHRGRPRVDLQVVEEALQVCSDGPPGDTEPRGDLFVLEAERDELHDLGLSRGEERNRRFSARRRSIFRLAHAATLGSVRGRRIARIDHRGRTIRGPSPGPFEWSTMPRRCRVPTIRIG